MVEDLLAREPPAPELLFLAHRGTQTRWDRLDLEVPSPDWTRHLDGTLTNRWRLPNGVEFEARVGAPSDGGVDLGLTIRNGSTTPLRRLRAEVCVLLGAIPEFATELSTRSRRTVDRGAVAVPSLEGQRHVVVIWQHGRAGGDDACPCAHSDPWFPDLAPGESATRRGRVQFHDGPSATEAIQRARAALARASRGLAMATELPGR